MGSLNYFGKRIVFWLFKVSRVAFLRPELLKAFPDVWILPCLVLLCNACFLLLLLQCIKKILIWTRAWEPRHWEEEQVCPYTGLYFITFRPFYILIKNITAARVMPTLLKHLLAASHATVHPAPHWSCAVQSVERKKNGNDWHAYSQQTGNKRHPQTSPCNVTTGMWLHLLRSKGEISIQAATPYLTCPVVSMYCRVSNKLMVLCCKFCNKWAQQDD